MNDFQDTRVRFKKAAAIEAAREVRSGMRIGLGHGSTAIWAIRDIAEALRQGTLEDIKGVAVSRFIENEAKTLGIPIISLQETPHLDLTIDGADKPHKGGRRGPQQLYATFESTDRFPGGKNHCHQRYPSASRRGSRH